MATFNFLLVSSLDGIPNQPQQASPFRGTFLDVEKLGGGQGISEWKNSGEGSN